MTRWSRASSGMTSRHAHQCCGQPWTSMTGGASSGPASATCVRRPPASTHSCVTPATAGGFRPCPFTEQQILDGAPPRGPLRWEAEMEASPSERRFASDHRDPTAGTDAAVSFVPTPVADPGPLGLAAFALTTFVLSMFNADLVAAGGKPVVLGLAVAYGGLAQLLAGMWEFRTGNTFGAVAFTSYGAFWLSFFALDQFFAKDIPKADAGHAIGLFLIAWGVFTTYMFVASLRTTAAIAVVFALLAVTFIVLGIGEANGNADIVKIGGWTGLATAVAAWYASFAAVVNHTFGRVALPVRPLAR